MSEERRTERMIDKALKLWPIAAVLVASLAGWIKMQIDVSAVQKCPEEIKSLEKRIIILETQAEISKRYRARRER